MKRLAVNGNCDELGCRESSVWCVEFESRTYNWCKKHFLSRMKSDEFWARTYRAVRKDSKLPNPAFGNKSFLSQT